MRLGCDQGGFQQSLSSKTIECNRKIFRCYRYGAGGPTAQSDRWGPEENVADIEVNIDFIAFLELKLLDLCIHICPSPIKVLRFFYLFQQSLFKR